MSDATVHIAAWEAAGVIDRETADRLRAAAVNEGAQVPDATPRSAAADLFGPSVTIPEVFGYLGGGFLLGAWSLFSSRANPDGGIVTALLLLAAAGALVGIGIVLRGRGERAARAAGVTLVAATIYASAAALSIATQTSSTYAIANIVAAAVGLVAAIAVRRFHPSVVTHAAALGWTVALGVALLQLIQDQLLTTDTGLPAAGGPGPIALSLASAVFWLALAVGIGLIGLAEARSAVASGSRAAARRAALSRFWAGMTAVIGVYSALTRSGVLENDEYGRIIEPIVAEIALVVLAAVLLERAFRREATSFMYAAALGLILALTDLNVSYLSDRAEVALLVEGLILLGVGFVANRLRRTIVGSTGPDGVGSGIPADVPPASGLADLAPDPANLP